MTKEIDMHDGQECMFGFSVLQPTRQYSYWLFLVLTCCIGLGCSSTEPDGKKPELTPDQPKLNVSAGTDDLQTTLTPNSVVPENSDGDKTTASLLFQVTCYRGSLERHAVVEDFLGKVPERTYISEPEHQYPLCFVPDCCLNSPDIKLSRDEAFAIEKRDPETTLFVQTREIRLEGNQFVPAVVHARPFIDAVSIKMSVKQTSPFHNGSQSGTELLYQRLESSPWKSGITRGTNPWSSGTEVFHNNEQDVPFRIVLRGIRPVKAWIIPRHFASVSGDNGQIKIEGLPAGVPIKFQLFHPIIGHAFEGTKLGAEFNSFDKDGTIELKLKPGENNYGRVNYQSQLRISHFRRVAEGRLLFCWVA